VKGIIYKTTNLVNGKFYIGQDCKNDPNYFGSGKLIKKAIDKYGRDKFKKEVLCECSSRRELDAKEKFWIAKLDATNNKIAYNIMSGGYYSVTGRKANKYTPRPKQSEAMKGRNTGKENPMYGKIGSLNPAFALPTKQELRIIKKMAEQYASIGKIASKTKHKKPVVLRWLQEYLPDVYEKFCEPQMIDFKDSAMIHIVLQFRENNVNKFSHSSKNGPVTIAAKINELFNLKGDYAISYKKIQNLLNRYKKENR
jgi:group I intron endonuclease